jgi:hypothetical protein
MAVTDIVLQQAEQFLVEAIKANYLSTTGDELDLRSGTPQYDLFVRAQLPVVAQIIDMINTAARKTTLLAADELTDSELAAVGDRFFVTRSAGEAASGTVAIKFVVRQSVQLTTNDMFEQNGLVYYPQADVSVTPEQLVEDPTFGYFYTRVQLRAAEPGSQYVAAVGTLFTSAALSSNTNVIEIISVAPMIGGRDQESAAAYAERIRTAPVVANLVNRLSIEKVLYGQFPSTISRLAVAGYQDPEMKRDQITVDDPVAGTITLAIGGHTDIYVKTPIVRDTVEIFVAAGEALVSLEAYRAVLKVHSVKVKGKPELAPFFDLQGSTPSLRFSAKDPAYLFVDPGVTNETLLVDISYAPDVVRIDDYVNDPINRVICANTLVRYFHPVWLAGTVYAEGLSTDQKNQALANIQSYLDGLQVEENVAVSQVTAAVHAAGAVNVIQDYDLFAQVLYGDGTIFNTSSPYVLSFPENLTKGFSPRVACFINEAITIESIS